MTRQQEKLVLELGAQICNVNATLAELLKTFRVEEYVGIAKAAEITGLTYRQLRTRAQQGKVKVDASEGGGKLLFWRPDLEELVSQTNAI